MSLDRVSSKTILQTGDSGGVDAKSTPENLKGSKGVQTGGTTGGTVPQDDPQVPPKGQGVPKDTHALTSKITGKRDQILDNLPGPLNQALHDRISGGEVSAKDLKKLLHFSHFSTKDTTPETRVEIRTILAQAVASGMSLDEAAALKSALRTASPEHLKTLREGITSADTLAEGLCKAIKTEVRKKLNGSDAPGLTALCKTVLSHLPADPGKAGERMHVSTYATISHDAKGQPHLEYACARCLPVTPLNHNVTANDINAIRQIYDEVCSTKYSRMNPHLQLMEAFREAKRDDPSVTLSEVFDSFHFDGNTAVKQGDRGDCLSLTARLMEKLGELGINARIIGQYSENLTMQMVARNPVEVGDRDQQTGGLTHSDIMIPYRTDSGEDRVLLIEPGLGATDDHFFDKSATEFLSAFGRSKKGSGDGGNVDLAKVNREAMGYLTNLQMKNTDETTPDTDRHMFGVDLIGGTVYLNGNSSKAYEGVRLAEGGAVSFNYRDIMANPDATVDMKLPNGSGGFDTVTMTKLEALTMFLEAVATDYGQPEGFVENMLTLFQHEADFKDLALWQSVKDIHQI